MALNSKIEWTHHTANLWWGCTNVHEGCDNCYAERWANKYGVKWGNDAPRRDWDVCWQKGVAYFFKQVDKVRPVPDDLIVRQFPN